MTSSSGPAPTVQRQGSEEETDLKIALEEACLEAGVTLSSTHFSPLTGFWLWGEQDAASPGKLAGWFASARKRSFWPLQEEKKRKRSDSCTSDDASLGALSSDASKQLRTEPLTAEEPEWSATSLKERLGKAVELDICSGSVPWQNLLTVCRTEHMRSSTEEEEKSGAMEVTVNSGGVVYFLLFKSGHSETGEAAVCIKFAPSRLATQSELFGLELARSLGVLTPQARVVHSAAAEWSEITAAVEETQKRATTEENEMGEHICAELLEALNINRSLLLMGYIDGTPLLDCPEAFDVQDSAEKTAATLGRVLVLDLVLRNEDRFVCKRLGWRGNHGNLMATKKPVLSRPTLKQMGSRPLPPKGSAGSADKQHPWGFRKQLRNEFESTFGRRRRQAATTPEGSAEPVKSLEQNESKAGDRQLFVVAIDSGVPRRPPSSKAEKDKAEFPQFVELLLNDEGVASEILQEISGKNLGCLDMNATKTEADSVVNELDQLKVVKAFQGGFRGGTDDMQDLHAFLLKLFRRFNHLLREFVTYMASIEDEKLKEDSPSNRTSRRSSLNGSSPSLNEVELRLGSLGLESAEKSTESSGGNGSRKSASSTPRTPPSRQDSPDLSDSLTNKSSRRSSRERMGESWNGKLMESRSNSPQFSSRLTLKLKNVNKSAKVDGELCKALDWWDEKMRKEGQQICREQDFITGFLDHSSSHSLVDSYELKIRLDHLLERMALIEHGVQTERPSLVLKFLYIGGALAARAFHTLQHIGITDVLCLCPNELSTEDDYPDAFSFKSFQVRDGEDENIGRFFEGVSSYIDSVEEKGGAILVHCFEGKSRSAAVILGYLMLRKGHTLFQAWGLLKAAHPRAQPNDGFMKILVQLDSQLHGEVSMDWQQKKPQIRMCPVCGRSAGISNSSLRQHLRRTHPDVTQVPLTTSKSPEGHQMENTTAPLENLLSAVGV